MELVSVVVPIYKVEKYLEKCVSSIQRQTYQNLEIILVDDGSPDHSGEMCDVYVEKDSRICVIHKANGGLSDARNAGAEKATGKYLLFVDSDDYIAEDLIEKAVRTAEKTCCDIVLFDYFHVEDGIKEIRETNLPPKKKISLEKEKNLLLIPPASWLKLFNREFYERTGISFPKGRYYEDLGTTPKFVLEAGSVVYLPEALYYYIVRKDSIMGSKDYIRNYRDKKHVLEDVLNYYKDRNVYDRYKEELEYLVFANLYFEPSKEMVLAGVKADHLQMARTYIYQNFSKFCKNKYVCQLGKKDRLHIWILNTRQYWLMRLLSKSRQVLKKGRGRYR